MPKISAVIITYNEEKFIDKCLASIDGIADEIVVVDSFSTDATEEICKKSDLLSTSLKDIEIRRIMLWGLQLIKIYCLLMLMRL
jgi:GT2 family glycosyltransferase